jgi:hypothetical protein
MEKLANIQPTIESHEERGRTIMDTTQRERAELYAHLASIPKFEDLKEWEQLKWRDETERVILPFVYDPDEDLRLFAQDLQRKEQYVFPQTSRRSAAKLSEDEIRRRCAEMLLALAWRLVTRDIPPLLAGQPIHIRLALEGEWVLENGVLIERHERAGAEEKLLWDLGEVLKQKPFPFRQCPICRSVFVPVKRQIYCSPACTYKGTELARKGSRKEYMRKFMKKRREKAKALQGRKEK